MDTANAPQFVVSPDGTTVPPVVVRRLLGPTATWVSALVLALAIVHPPHGLGVPVCWLHATTGIPCPGCGLSRSLSCTVRGDLATAWNYHPFGPALLPLLTAIVVARLLPRPARQRLAACCDRHERAFRAGYGVLIGLFIVFGVLRAGLFIWRAGVHASV